MTLHLQALVTVLSLMNPVMCAVIFSGIESGRSPAQRLLDGSKAVLAILVILELSALFGASVLNLFGISLISSGSRSMPSAWPVAESWCGWGSPCFAGLPPNPVTTRR